MTNAGAIRTVKSASVEIDKLLNSETRLAGIDLDYLEIHRTKKIDNNLNERVHSNVKATLEQVNITKRQYTKVFQCRNKKSEAIGEQTKKS